MSHERSPAIPASSDLDAYRRMFDLTGRTALVTGASRGIGRAIALALATFGCNIAVHFTTGRMAADAVAASAVATGRRAVAIPADFASGGEGRRLARAAQSALGDIDILIASASIEIEQAFEDVTAAEFDRQINVNLRSTLELMQELLPRMAARRWGRVLTIGSVQEASPSPRKAVYAASKSAQSSLVCSMAKEYAPLGVTVNNLAPGLVLSDRTAGLREDPTGWQRKIDAIPVGRAGEPNDMVGVALLLCSGAGSYITGQSVFADGGLSFPGGRR